MSEFIREIKMPLTIRAFTLPDANGYFNIYLNESLSPEAKEKALRHERNHIIKNDFSSPLPARLIENLR